MGETDSFEIREGILVPDTITPTDEGIQGAHTCSVRIDGALARAYIKPLTWPKLVCECFAALLLRHWGLTVPEPIVVPVDGTAWFGSLDAGYPSLSRRFLLMDDATAAERTARTACAIDQLLQFSDLPLALACDEAIANADRNLGNILWDGERAAWIDHDQTFDLSIASDNKLASMAIYRDNFTELQHASIDIAMTLDAKAVDQIIAAVPHSKGCARLVEKRARDLPMRIIARFPIPRDDIFASH